VELLVREIRPQLPPSPPLVAIHGGPSWDHSYLLPGLLPVATARYVILVDMRGCGRTSRDLVPDAYQPEFVIDDLARLMEVLGHEQVDLLGFSTGGQVALLFAEAQPDRIRGAQDMVFPVQLAQRLHQAVPNSRLCIIDAAGHMAQFEQPAPWAKRGCRVPVLIAGVTPPSRSRRRAASTRSKSARPEKRSVVTPIVFRQAPGVSRRRQISATRLDGRCTRSPDVRADRGVTAILESSRASPC
jgi:hypothetical protein